MEGYKQGYKLQPVPRGEVAGSHTVVPIVNLLFPNCLIRIHYIIFRMAPRCKIREGGEPPTKKLHKVARKP